MVTMATDNKMQIFSVYNFEKLHGLDKYTLIVCFSILTFRINWGNDRKMLKMYKFYIFGYGYHGNRVHKTYFIGSKLSHNV